MKTFCIASAFALVATTAAASDFGASLSELADAKLKAIAAEGFLVDAVKASNAARVDVGQDQIDALDKDWRAQVGTSPAPVIDPIMSSEASAQLAAIRDESEGMFTEIFAMGDKGLNVAASDVTSDYWQGDEAKWQDTFLVGADAVHISEVELDESTQTYQSQVSLTIVDPATSAPIGAITFGVNVEFLE